MIFLKFPANRELDQISALMNKQYLSFLQFLLIFFSATLSDLFQAKFRHFMSIAFTDSSRMKLDKVVKSNVSTIEVEIQMSEFEKLEDHGGTRVSPEITLLEWKNGCEIDMGIMSEDWLMWESYDPFYDSDTSEHKVDIWFRVRNMKSVTVDINLFANENFKVPNKFYSDREDWLSENPYYIDDIVFGLKGGLKSLKGSIVISYEPLDSLILKQEFVANLSTEVKKNLVDLHQQPKNFTILVDEKEFKFSKDFLCEVSDVFSTMICRQDYLEAAKDSVKLTDVYPETIDTFQKLFLEDENIEDECITVDLFYFANKWNIQPIVDLCEEQLIKLMNEDNVLEIVQAAYLIGKEEMLEIASKYIKKMDYNLKKDEEWNQFKKANPECVIKMMEYMFFD